MARSFSYYNNALTTLDNNFDLIFVVDNNEDLNKIHYCFKQKLTNQEYLALYDVNYAKYSSVADLSLIENDYKKILARLTDINDLRAELKTKL
jgi:hypothetical protein